jgi:hypothetical protein
MTRPTAAIVETVARYECPKCGNNCSCGVPYVAKMVRATEAVKANREKSDRAIAKDIGVSQPTVSKARKEVEATDKQFSVEARTGLDGKIRKLPERKADEEVRKTVSEAADEAAEPWKIHRGPTVTEDGQITFPEPTKKEKTPDEIAESFAYNIWNEANSYAREHGLKLPRFRQQLWEIVAPPEKVIAYLDDDGKPITKADFAELYERAGELNKHNSALSEALDTREQKAGRVWPEMNQKQAKKRQSILATISYWQRELERLYGDVTGTPSWSVSLVKKDGTRLESGVRFPEKGPAEQWAKSEFQKKDDLDHSEVMPSKDKPNVDPRGDLIGFHHGGCVLFNWHAVT